MDTYVRPETYGIAALAAGGAILASRFAVENSSPAMALVRPPGHHAGPSYAGGFCYFNNAAIAAEWLIRSKQTKRVAIVDFDVHHGNGTAEIFKSRSDVLFISTHLYGIYPGTGAAEDTGDGQGEGYTINIPFVSGCGDASFLATYEQIIEPVLNQFKPNAVIVSLGIDSHYRDTLGSLTLSSGGYIDICSRLIDFSRGRCAFTLEGGYDFDATADVIAGLASKSSGKTTALRYTDVVDRECAGSEVITRVKRIQSQYWKL